MGTGRELATAAALWAACKPAEDAPPAERVRWLFDKADLLERLADSGHFHPVITAELRELAQQADAQGFDIARRAGS